VERERERERERESSCPDALFIPDFSFYSSSGYFHAILLLLLIYLAIAAIS
jgi:hypothetical protein